MIKIKGKFNEAIVYASVLEDAARKQLEAICDMEAYRDSRIRIMPDVHAGAGCTIGTTMTLKDAVTPNMVGVDIGCGMETVMIEEKEIDFEQLDQFIRRNIPCGNEIRNRKHDNADRTRVDELRCLDRIRQMDRELRAIGSLGGGNHFIEIDKDEEGNLYLVIHSGSRHLGKKVADIYQDLAYRRPDRENKEELQKKIDELKAQGRQQEIQAMIGETKKNVVCDVGRDLAYVTDQLFDDYIHDMKIMQEYADINRKTMVQIILDGMGWTETDRFTTVHNYIDTDRMILRKGSVSALKGERLLIPINMRDGSLICTGKGNEEWNCSAPHGAGRIMSRSEAFQTLSVDEFEKQMEGIYSTTVNARTLDESPMAYKDMKDIVGNIEDTAKIERVIKPVYNFKAE